MFEIIKNVILSKNYKLEDILSKIDIVWLEAKISDDERLSLISLARENAIAENSYSSNEKIFKEIFDRLEKIENIVFKDDEAEEYPEYAQPAGAHDSYKVGDKITYNGKKYICKLDNCVWAPDVYPEAWEEVAEEIENTENKVEVQE